MALLQRSGRPKAMQSKPVFMEAVFDDPDRAMALIERASPYQTLPAYHGAQVATEYSGQALFRHAMTDDAILHNPNWIAAARASFGATIVEPVRCLLNCSAPMEEMSAHTDLPTFRGFVPQAETGKLLRAMIHSGLFFDWMVPFASGLVWFYRGEGGAFLYWADGVDAAPQVIRPPFWNNGLMSDNEAMFHAVSAVGSAEDRVGFSGTVSHSARLYHTGGDAWEIRDEERVVARLDRSRLRMSLLWRGRVFRDEAHRASFEDTSFDLTPELIAEVFLQDLAARGVAAEEPSDPLDPAWQDFLARSYPPPFTVATADYVN